MSIFKCGTIKANNKSKDAILARISNWDQYYGNIDAETAGKINVVREALSRQTNNDKKNAANSDWVINDIIDKINVDLASGNYGVPKIRLDLLISEITTRANGGRSDGNKSYANDSEIQLALFIAKLRGNYEKLKAEHSVAAMKLANCASLYGEDSNEYQIEYKEYELVDDKYNSATDLLTKKLDDRNTGELIKIIDEQNKVYTEGNAELDANVIIEKYAALRKVKDEAKFITDTAGGVRDDMNTYRESNKVKAPRSSTARGSGAAFTGGANRQSFNGSGVIDLENIKGNIVKLEQTENVYNEKIEGINAEYIAVCNELAEMIQSRKNMHRGTRASINSKINSLYTKKCTLQKTINIYSAYRDTVSKNLELYKVADAIQDGKNVNELLKNSGIALGDVESQAMKIQSDLKALEAEIAKLDSVGAVIENAVPRANAVLGGEAATDEDLDDKFDYMLEDPKF